MVMIAVNASAERAENAASSATESAASAEETLIEIKRVADGISEDIENANTAKSELSDTINSAEEKKKELESSIGKAGETKTSLDSAISSAGEKQLALDATVEQANAVDGSLKEHIGSAEQIQANVEQIAKNKADISSLNEDLGNVEDIVGKRINGIFNENDYTSSLVLEAGTTYHIFYGSGSAANLYIQGDTSMFISVDEGGLYEFTPKVTGNINLFRKTVDSKNNIVFYIGTDLTFFRDIRKNASDIENGFETIQAEVNETREKIRVVETSVNSIFVEKKSRKQTTELSLLSL